jgi:hypothetical protein
LTCGTGTFARSRPHWLLALALPFSRNDQALAPEGVGAGARTGPR